MTSATFSPDGRFALTTSADHTARLWDLEQKPPQAVVFAPETQDLVVLYSAIFSPNGRLILTVSEQGTARLYDFTPTTVSMFDHTSAVDHTSAFDHIAASGANLWRLLLGR